MASKISIQHAMEASEWFESIFGRDNVAIFNDFMRGVDEGYNIQESWHQDPKHTGNNLYRFKELNLKPQDLGRRVGSMAYVFDYQGHSEQPLLLHAHFSGPSSPQGDLLS
jgi:hypothetical protein